MKKAIQAVSILISLASIPLHAFDAQNFKPATEGGLYYGVYGSRPLSPGDFSVGLITDYAHEPVILQNAAGAKTQNLIDREMGAHLSGGYGILDWLDVGLLVSTAPYLVFRTSDNATTAADESVTTATRIRMSDVALNARFRILDNQEKPIGLSVLPMVTFPSGGSGSFVGNSNFTGGGLVIVETRRFKDRFSAALNLGYQIREREVISTQTTMNDTVSYGLAGNLSLLPQLDLLAELRGFTLVGDLFGAQQRPLEWTGGVRYYPAPRWAVSAGGGSVILEGFGNPIFRALAGVSFIPGHKSFVKEVKVEIKPVDTDGDGVNDIDDHCPTEAGDATNRGCPPAPKIVISPEEYRVLTRQLNFDVSKATLKNESLPILDTLADALKVKPEIKKLSIEGHCDERGSDAFNQKLSEARAKMVQSYLIDRGLDASRLEIVGLGESKPIDPGHNQKAWKKNRRVEFVFKEVDGLVIPDTVPQSQNPVLPDTPQPLPPPTSPAPQFTPLPPSKTS